MDSGAWQAKVPGVTRESDMTEAAFAAVQSLSRVRLFVTPWTAARQASLSFSISWRLLKLLRGDSAGDDIQRTSVALPVVTSGYVVTSCCAQKGRKLSI